MFLHVISFHLIIRRTTIELGPLFRSEREEFNIKNDVQFGLDVLILVLIDGGFVNISFDVM
jgi:hypothetical protein